jgi:excisionase family DNA binding protein
MTRLPPYVSGPLALSVAEAAEAIGVSERHLRDFLCEIPHVRLGTRVVIPVDRFRAWLWEQAELDLDSIDTVVNGLLADLEREQES